MGRVTKISCSKLVEILEQTIKLDIRERLDASTGVIESSFNVPLPYLEPRHLDEHKSVVLISTNNNQFNQACERIDCAKEVFWLDGGIEAWKSKNLELKPFMRLPFVKTFYEKNTATNQFVVVDDLTKETLIIDSVLNFEKDTRTVSFESANEILEYVEKWKLNVKGIIETHVHADHLTASQYLKWKLWKKQGILAKVCIGEKVRTVQEYFGKLFHMKKEDYENSFDHLYKIGDEFKLGDLDCKTIYTPGHTPDSLSYLIGDCVFSGDSIFMPDVGCARCDFPGGDAKELYQNLQNQIFTLPKNTLCFVGHDYPPTNDEDLPIREPKSQTTVEQQRKQNLHINQNTKLDEFVKWRIGRDANLGEPRLLYFAIQVNIRGGRLPGMENVNLPFECEWKPELFKLPYKIKY